MSIAVARSPLASPALKHALNTGASYFSMSTASNAVSPGPSAAHLAVSGLPTGPPAGFTLRMPSRGGDQSPVGEAPNPGFGLRVPQQLTPGGSREGPRSPHGGLRVPARTPGPVSPSPFAGVTPTEGLVGLRLARTPGAISPHLAAPTEGLAALKLARTPDHSPFPPGTLGSTLDGRSQLQLQALIEAPLTDFTLKLPSGRGKNRGEGAAPAEGAAVQFGDTGKGREGLRGKLGKMGALVGLVRRTVRFVLPQPVPKRKSEFRSCRNRPPTPYPRNSEAEDYFSDQSF